MTGPGQPAIRLMLERLQESARRSGFFYLSVSCIMQCSKIKLVMLKINCALISRLCSRDDCPI